MYKYGVCYVLTDDCKEKLMRIVGFMDWHGVDILGINLPSHNEQIA
jgi:hypothetical protein